MHIWTSTPIAKTNNRQEYSDFWSLLDFNALFVLINEWRTPRNTHQRKSGNRKLTIVSPAILKFSNPKPLSAPLFLSHLTHNDNYIAWKSSHMYALINDQWSSLRSAILSLFMRMLTFDLTYCFWKAALKVSSDETSLLNTAKKSPFPNQSMIKNMTMTMTIILTTIMIMNMMTIIIEIWQNYHFSFVDWRWGLASSSPNHLQCLGSPH